MGLNQDIVIIFPFLPRFQILNILLTAGRLGNPAVFSNNMKIKPSNSRNKGDIDPIYVIFIVLCFIFLILGWAGGMDTIKHQAIQANVAHYTVNPQTGVTQFEWITNSVK